MPDPTPAIRAEAIRLGIGPELAERLTDLIGHADELRLGELAPATLNAYGKDFADFERWCAGYGASALPALGNVVAVYLAHLERDTKLSVSAISRRLAAIATTHRLRGHASPTKHAQVRAVWNGIRRKRRTRPQKKEALITEHLRAVLAPLGDALVDRRDRALLLVGFTGALRRSELATLECRHLRPVARGIEVLVPQSKTDPFGKGQVIGIPRGEHAETCPVRALEAWLETAQIADGFVFRYVDRWGRLGDRQAGRSAAHLNPATIARIIKDRCAAATLTPEIFSGHSLRRGFVTSARAAGADWSDIRRQTRHKSVIVAEGYETAEVWGRNHPTERLGL